MDAQLVDAILQRHPREAGSIIQVLLDIQNELYYLPRDVLEYEIDWIRKLGVDIVTNTALGRDFDLNDLFQQGYYAVFLGIGAHKGQKLRVAGEELPGVYAQIERELEVIADLKFPGYFLVVWDFIRHARESGVPVGPGRGSAAGSLVAYCSTQTHSSMEKAVMISGIGLDNLRNEGIPDDKVRFVGEPVAAVAAVDRHVAEEALALIVVQYEVLPFVLDMNDALEPGDAQCLHDRAPPRVVAARGHRHDRALELQIVLALHLLDQRVLPSREHWVACGTVEAVADAIRTMVVRGAPAIGISARPICWAASSRSSSWWACSR